MNRCFNCRAALTFFAITQTKRFWLAWRQCCECGTYHASTSDGGVRLVTKQEPRL